MCYQMKERGKKQPIGRVKTVLWFESSTAERVWVRSPMSTCFHIPVDTNIS